jgi:hypothetical protein
MYEKVCRENGYIAGIHHLMVLGDDLFFSFKYKDIVYAVYNRKEKAVALYSCLLENLPNPSRIAGKNDEGAVIH